MKVQIQAKWLFMTAVVIFYSTGSFGEEDIDYPSREISVTELPEIVGSENEVENLYEEFAGIKNGQRQPWTVAALPENIKKNRYDDLLAFDHSRVVLEPLPDIPHSDYINANYLDGQNSEREYVATQGPLPNTVNDFWRLVWQINASKIIMLANVIEHGKTKVEKYWPETTSSYGNIEVTKLIEYSIPRLQHVIRTFSVRKTGIIQPRIIRQFHFTGWPDFGVPEDRLSVLSIVRQARLYNPESKAPLLIHCSAGVGRTGTIILTDSMIQRGKAEGLVDFPKRLDHMRTLRPDVVEKKEQYVFAYKAVNDVFNVPEAQQYFEEVEEEYRKMDREMNVEDLVAPKDMRQMLQRMKWHNTVMRLFIKNALERTNSLNGAEKDESENH